MQGNLLFLTRKSPLTLMSLPFRIKRRLNFNGFDF